MMEENVIIHFSVKEAEFCKIKSQLAIWALFSDATTREGEKAIAVLQQSLIITRVSSLSEISS